MPPIVGVEKDPPNIKEFLGTKEHINGAHEFNQRADKFILVILILRLKRPVPMIAPPLGILGNLQQQMLRRNRDEYA